MPHCGATSGFFLPDLLKPLAWLAAPRANGGAGEKKYPAANCFVFFPDRLSPLPPPVTPTPAFEAALRAASGRASAVELQVEARPTLTCSSPHRQQGPPAGVLPRPRRAPLAADTVITLRPAVPVEPLRATPPSPPARRALETRCLLLRVAPSANRSPDGKPAARIAWWGAEVCALSSHLPRIRVAQRSLFRRDRR